MLDLREKVRMSTKSTSSYIPLPLAEIDSTWVEAEKAETESPKPSRCYRLAGIGILIGLTGLLALFIATRLRSTYSKNGCGISAAEARANGCVFELTGSSWVNKDCYDPELEAEFIAFKDWRFYKDINYTQEVSLEEVRRGEGPGYFVPQDYHATHCGFLLRKMHRAVNKGGKLDGLIASIHHTSHCVQWMTDPPEDRYNLPQFAYTKYPYCGRVGGYNVDGLHRWVNP